MTPCRLCSQTSEMNVDIFDDSYKNHDLQLKINQLFSFWVDKKDSLTSICTECTNRVLDFYTFSEHVKQTQIILLEKKLIGRVPTEDTNVENQGDYKNVELQQKTILNNIKTEFIDNKEIKIEFCDSTPVDNSEGPHVDSEDLVSNDYSDVNIDTQDQKKESIDALSDELPKKRIDFPAELIRNGKMIIKKPEFKELINDFFSLHCLLCADRPIFNDHEKLMNHISSVHKTKGYITCCSCNVNLFTHRSIYFHLAKHLQPSAFECPICKKQVSRPHILKMHVEKHFETPKVYKCEECDKSFLHERTLIRHNKFVHMPEDEREHYDCDDCGREHISKSLLTAHIKSIHQSVRSFLCAICGKPFPNKSQLNGHMFSHDPTGKNKVRCKQCNCVFKHAKSLKKHQKRHLEKKFYCSDCSYSTYTEYILNQHKKHKHTNEKPYVCSFCEKSFKTKHCLNAHLPQHTGEIKYACKFCPRTFVSSGNCTAHQKRIHAEEYKKHLARKHTERIIDCEPTDIVQETSTSDAYEAARKLLSEMSETRDKIKHTK